MCFANSLLTQIDREFIAIFDAAQAAEVDAGWSTLEPLALAQGKVSRIEREAARAIARHKSAVAYLHHVIVECAVERLPKRLLISAAQDEEMLNGARKRAERRLVEARLELAALAPKPKAVVRHVLAPKPVESKAQGQINPLVQSTATTTGENDARHSVDRESKEVIAPSHRGQWQMDPRAVRRRTRYPRESLAQKLVGASGLARDGRFRERGLRIPGHRTCAVHMAQQCVNAGKLRNTAMVYETIGSRDEKLISMMGKLCGEARESGYYATLYGGTAGTFRVEFSKNVGRRRTPLGRLEIKAFGPLTLMGPVPKDVRDLCAKLVVP
ncbi:hypothetical protein EKK58_05545 [Candidatus Dependentiae bacterium]|nr:MAG: hypothetical protein EKK58_05545 [Candidatus Dependentiae bacterium]